MQHGQIVLTPVRIQRGDAVRAKLAELGLTEGDTAAAVAWARSPRATGAMVAEPKAEYAAKPAKAGKAQKATAKAIQKQA